MMHPVRFAAFVIALVASIAGCGNNTPTQPNENGIHCQTSDVCPTGMACEMSSQVCVRQPTSTGKLDVTIEAALITETSANIVVHVSTPIKDYTISIVGPGNQSVDSLHGNLTDYELGEFSLPENKLSPHTKYLAEVFVTGLDGQHAAASIEFITETGPVRFTNATAVIDPRYTDVTVIVFSWTLTAPARVYLFTKYNPNDPWAEVSWDVQKATSVSLPVGPYKPGMRVYWRLVARDDNDDSLDSWEEFIDIPQ